MNLETIMRQVQKMVGQPGESSWLQIMHSRRCGMDYQEFVVEVGGVRFVAQIELEEGDYTITDIILDLPTMWPFDDGLYNLLSPWTIDKIERDVDLQMRDYLCGVV